MAEAVAVRSSVRRIGPISVRFEGTELLSAGTRRWVGALGDRVDEERGGGDGGSSAPGGVEVLAADPAATLTIRFTRDLVPGGRRFAPYPVSPADDGDLWVTDPGGRPARVPLTDPLSRPALVHPDIGFFTFQEWVWLPLLRIALWRSDACLLRTAGVVVDGTAVAIAAPMRTGKTTAVLELLRDGGSLLGDDWLCLGGDGTVSLADSLVTIRDNHGDGPSTSRAGTVTGGVLDGVRRAAARAAAWLARRSGRWPQIAVGLSRVAEVLWILGFRSLPVEELLPGSGTASPTRLALLAHLAPEDLPSPRPSDVPGMLAAQARLDTEPLETLETIARYCWPDLATRDLAPEPGAESRFVARALAGVPTVVIEVDARDADGRAVAARIRREVGR